MTVSRGHGRRFVDLAGRRAADPLESTEATSSLRIVDLERIPGRTAHRHPHSEEVVYIAAGQGVVWINGTVAPIGTGDVVHIPRGAAHATIPEEGVSMRLVCFFPHPDLLANVEETDIEVS